jgi:hypothetical protein
MSIANDIIFLSLRNSGVNGVGQTPLADDVNDSYKIMNGWINQGNLERRVKVNPIVLPTFPDLTTDVPFWTPYEHVLLTTMAVRLRQIYSLPPVEIDVKMAEAALETFNAINQQQVAPIHGGIPETVQQAVFLALRMAGRITDTQSVSDTSKDVNDAFALLVMMLGQWQRKRWLVWSEQEIAIIATGEQFYTIGPGEELNIARPDKIHAAWCRLVTGTPGATAFSEGDLLPALLPFPLGAGAESTSSAVNPIDIPLQIIEAHEDWAQITIKDLKSIPGAVFYDSAWPVGRVYFWPVPSAGQYEMHLVVKAQLPIYSSVNDALNLPPEYLDAIVNNLACRIIVASGGQISPFLLGQAKASLETIRMANSQIPLLSMPPALSGHRGGDRSSWAGAGLNQAWTVGGSSVLG